MQVIKVVGCPGSGKTTQIIKALKGEPNPIANIKPNDEVLFLSMTRSTVIKAHQEEVRAYTFREYFSKDIKIQDYAKLKNYLEAEFKIVLPDNIRDAVRENTYFRFLVQYFNSFVSLDVFLQRASYYKDIDLDFLKRFIQASEMFIRNVPVDKLFYRMVEDIVPTKTVDWLVIDEAQDLTPIMWHLAFNKINARKGAILIGDPNQAIFSSFGSDPKMFILFKHDKIVFFTKSYRVPNEVVRLSQQIINRNTVRISYDWTGTEGGEIKYFTSLKEIIPEIVSLEGDTFVIVNYSKAVVPLGLRFLNEGFVVKNGYGVPFYSKRLHSYLKYAKKVIYLEEMPWEAFTVFANSIDRVFFIKNRLDPEYYRELGKKILGKIPKAIVQKDPLFSFIRRVYKESGLEGLRLIGNRKIQSLWKKYKQVPLLIWQGSFNKVKGNVYVGVVHQFKGREADNVVYVHSLGNKKNLTYLEENRRMAFVAITRCKQRALIKASIREIM